MPKLILLGVVWASPLGAASLYDVIGKIAPETQSTISVFGVSGPFFASTQTAPDGRFQFRKLRAGTYSLVALVPGRGEARMTFEAGPGTSDSHGRVILNLNFEASDFAYGDAVRRRASVTKRQLSIPSQAKREYEQAQKELGKGQAEAAIAHLDRAVAIAPQFAPAWNQLGTLSYQKERYVRAEECFRTALEQEPAAYEALVNLGGVEINLGKLDQALEHNLRAVSAHPRDALANSQLGMTYFGLGKLDLALDSLEAARRIDPSHFSHPQLLIAQIHLRRREPALAVEALDDFLKRHPDSPEAASIRASIEAIAR